ncbi:MAG: PQQ-dependent sugar dehydrogenase [Verrucomicrobiales bacterium]|nr:PQQ-dependent sugar dehydrogenase [Verrucomicrobiales bacterium]
MFLSAGFAGAQIAPRVDNTSLNMPAEMFSSVAYELENLDPGEIGHPMALVSPPGDSRLFVVDRVGLIRVIDDLDDPSPSVFLDLRDRVDSDFLEEGLLGLAFHPQFSENGYFFVFYTRLNSDPLIVHDDTLSRFRVSSEDSSLGDPNSETILIRQPGDRWSQNHNGGDLNFTSDGFLLVSLGDGGISSNAQRIDADFRGAILRIDVDGKPGSLPPNTHPASVGPYYIPADNPFVGATSYHGSNQEKTAPAVADGRLGGCGFLSHRLLLKF